MLVMNSRLIGTPILSIQIGAPIGRITGSILDPHTLKIVAFRLEGPLIKENNLLDVKSIREYSNYGMVIDDIDELVTDSDIVRIQEVLKLNFKLIGLKVETKKGSKLGKVSDFSVTSEDFLTKQIVVKRPIVKSLNDPELIISRQEIVEITDYKVIVKDEEKTIKARANKEDFVPNFVNPFRSQKPDFVPADTKTPDDKDS